MTNNVVRYIIILFLFLVCLISCNQQEVYYQFVPLLHNSWNKQKEITFTIDSLAVVSDQTYNVNVEITHNTFYPYKNLFLYIEHNLCDTTFRRDTLECIFMNNKNNWLGYGNGSTRQLSTSFVTDIQLIDTVTYYISIRQNMRDLQLKGIEKVGVKIY